MCLAYDTLKEAVTSSNEGALNLCHSVQSLFELYCDVVPTYHREKLRNLHLMAGKYTNSLQIIPHTTCRRKLVRKGTRKHFNTT